jgi:hypothetical protein
MFANRGERVVQIRTLVLLGSVAISALPVAAKAADSYPPYAPPMTYGAAPPPVRMAAYGLPPYEVEAIVRSMGLRPIAPPLRRPRVYVVDAVDARGFRVRAIVHARRGDVLAVTPVYVAPPRYAAYPVHPRYGAVVTPDDDGIDVDVDVDVDVDPDRDERRPPVSSVAPLRTPRVDSATRVAKPSVQPSVKSAKADPAAAPTPRPRPAGADARAEQTASAPTGPIRKIEIKKKEPAPEAATRPESKPENKPESKPAEVTVPVAPLL